MIPKIKRIVNKPLIKKIHSIGYCEYCGSHFNLEAHHIKSRGSGGGDTDDNLICLCWKCHRLVHDGNIGKGSLKDIVRVRNEHRDITTCTAR